MRWRLVDRVGHRVPWKSIHGRKAVSLEEYHLLEPHGRSGSYPESLVLESCVELARWLAASSSDFALTAALEEVESFRLEKVVSMGEVLDFSLEAEERRDAELVLRCRVSSPSGEVAAGRISVRLTPLAESHDPGEYRELWNELTADQG